MLKWIHLLFFVLFLAIANAQVSANFGAPKFAPADGKKLLVLGQDLGAVGGLTSHQNGYVDGIDCHFPSGVTSYTSLPSLAGLESLANWGAGDVSAQAYLDEPNFDNSFIVIGLYIVGALDGIISGFTDNSIREFAAWVKNANRPVFIRIGYEFEGPWNNYNPTKYKEAWRHIVHLFDEENVRNASYVWQSAGLNYSNISNWYPGDEYVNWVGYSHFDGTNMGQSIRNFADEHDKPIMIAEATPRIDIQSGNAEGHWINWYLPLFNSIYENDRIKALAYINADWESQSMWTGQGWGDSRVQTVPFIKQTWETEIKKEPWITADENLFETLNYEEWITNTLEPEFELQETEIVIERNGNELTVRLNPGKAMSAIALNDFTGKIIYENTQTSFNYNIPIDHLINRPMILSVHFDNQVISKKEFIIGE